MALVTVAGVTVLSGRLSLPQRGAWTFQGKIDTATVPTGAVNIECAGGLTLTGTIDASQSGVFLDSSHVWVVGGAGGLGVECAGSYQSAQLRDPIDEVMRTSGEALADDVAASVLTASVTRYALGGSRAAACLDAIANFATAATASPVIWRIRPDGKVWIGTESWSSATLPETDEILDAFPSERRTVVGVATPTLAPGADVSGIGKAQAIDYWIDRHQVRAWLWT